MLWQINVEKDGVFVDSGIRLETDNPHAWIETQHGLDLRSYSAVPAKQGLMADLKQGWASFRKGLKR